MCDEVGAEAVGEAPKLVGGDGTLGVWTGGDQDLSFCLHSCKCNSLQFYDAWTLGEPFRSVYYLLMEL